MSELGNKVRMRREELRMTQDELAAKVGYKNKYAISKIETGHCKVPLDKLKLLASALGTDPLYLMGLSESPEEQAEFDSKILLDMELKETIRLYYTLSPDDRAFVRDTVRRLAKR